MIDNRIEYNQLIKDKIKSYYKSYYKDSLGIANWEELCEQRVYEEDIYCGRFIERIKSWIDYDFLDKKVLVVGSGTGGELVNFFKEGAEVFGIEPYLPAIEICHLKAEFVGLKKENIIQSSAEQVKFGDNSFDFVYCFTVLEHVNDVEQSISEMFRVTKPGGFIFIQTPDYRQLYEGHYKIPLPMFLPNIFNRIILKALGRPSNFLRTIQKVNTFSIRNILKKYNAVSLRIYTQEDNRTSGRVIVRIIFLIQDLINKYIDAPISQVWLVRKKGK